MKLLAAGLLILLVLLQYRLWFGDGSVREVARLQTEISAQEDQNARLRERNRTLAAEVQDLKKGTTAIEERARTDLGMVGKSETFYQVVSPEDAPSAQAPKVLGDRAGGRQFAAPGRRRPAEAVPAARRAQCHRMVPHSLPGT
jgi:cell division protein FtsB